MAPDAEAMGESGFLPHGASFLWHPDLIALHAVSDTIIALAFFSIPAILVAFTMRRKDLPFRNVFRMFSLSIMCCGTTHLLAVVVLWHPAYRLEGLVKAFAATAAIYSAIMLVPLLPKALALRSPSELDKLNRQLASTLAEKEQLLASFERAHFIATTFQSASLAEVPQRVGNLDISAIYRPGASEAEIGGDWYDVLALPDGRVLVSIGDVDGKGLSASVIMSKTRQAVRVLAQVLSDPSVILDAVDRAIRVDHSNRVVTAFIGVFNPTERTLRFASAGHPRPLMRSVDGAITELQCDDLPLGLRGIDGLASTPSGEVALLPGSLFVFYTDGLLESTHDNAEGERRLRSALQSKAVVLAPSPAEELQQAVLFDGIHDDVAILAVRVRAQEAA